jgi:hypothetical protein
MLHNLELERRVSCRLLDFEKLAANGLRFAEMQWEAASGRRLGENYCAPRYFVPRDRVSHV